MSLRKLALVSCPLLKLIADLYCFHIEALHSGEEIDQIISHIKDRGMKVGIAIKPKTPSNVLYPFIDKIDLALVMVPPNPV